MVSCPLQFGQGFSKLSSKPLSYGKQNAALKFKGHS
jgi:hypothetical protein